MELFFVNNGNIMMSQISALLLKDYRLLKKRVSEDTVTEIYKQWCLPLARLSCTFAPEQELRESVIKMGDDLDSKGLTYAAHICFMVAQVELGSRDQFHLIGSKSLPFGIKILNEAIYRTETYEYVLSLTSGLGQPDFQLFKLSHANRLAMNTFHDVAFKYCEVIARTLISLPGSFKRTFLERVILLSRNTQIQLRQEDQPEWLQELCRLHSVKVSEAKTNTKDQPMLPTSSKHEPMTTKIKDFQSPDPEQHIISVEEFNSRYTSNRLLGKGGFGSVYSGVRNEDERQVAIKYVKKGQCYRSFNSHDDLFSLPVEVALMERVCHPPCCSNIVEMLEWYNLPFQFVLILEYPSPCTDLKMFAKRYGGCLSEGQIRHIMPQVVQAVQHCRDRKVLHRDIKASNLLINLDTFEVKLIDFGCGVLLKDIPYKQYSGTHFFWPPELVLFEEYSGIPATVWSLGILMFNLLCGEYPFNLKEDIDDGCLNLCPGLSRDFLDLIMWCLELNPSLRPSLEEMVKHEWFTEGVPDLHQAPFKGMDMQPPEEESSSF
ncbi:serine/threonine-protein kinase pim-2-like isoform X1 [Silurus meridionalis]|nr:serine/threonine-protein kinase pim-2-like isoform X1 [Silurus meridionalis]